MAHSPAGSKLGLGTPIIYVTMAAPEVTEAALLAKLDEFLANADLATFTIRKALVLLTAHPDRQQQLRGGQPRRFCAA